MKVNKNPALAAKEEKIRGMLLLFLSVFHLFYSEKMLTLFRFSTSTRPRILFCLVMLGLGWLNIASALICFIYNKWGVEFFMNVWLSIRVVVLALNTSFTSCQTATPWPSAAAATWSTTWWRTRTRSWWDCLWGSGPSPATPRSCMRKGRITASLRCVCVCILINPAS